VYEGCVSCLHVRGRPRCAMPDELKTVYMEHDMQVGVVLFLCC
jgi:hypothetical protein